MRIYEKVHLVVATPGRILDLMEKKVILRRTFIQFLCGSVYVILSGFTVYLEWKASPYLRSRRKAKHTALKKCGDAYRYLTNEYLALYVLSDLLNAHDRLIVKRQST
jgi:hypothetical protein